MHICSYIFLPKHACDATNLIGVGSDSSSSQLHCHFSPIHTLPSYVYATCNSHLMLAECQGDITNGLMMKIGSNDRYNFDIFTQ